MDIEAHKVPVKIMWYQAAGWWFLLSKRSDFMYKSEGQQYGLDRIEVDAVETGWAWVDLNMPSTYAFPMLYVKLSPKFSHYN